MEESLTDTHSELKNLTSSLREKLQSLSEQVKSFKESKVESDEVFDTNDVNEENEKYLELCLKSNQLIDSTVVIIGNDEHAFQLAEYVCRLSFSRLVLIGVDLDDVQTFLSSTFKTSIIEFYNINEASGIIETLNESLVFNCSTEAFNLNIECQSYCFEGDSLILQDSLKHSPFELHPSIFHSLISQFFNSYLHSGRAISAITYDANLFSTTTIFENTHQQKENTEQQNRIEFVEPLENTVEKPLRPDDISSLAVQAGSVTGTILSPTRKEFEDTSQNENVFNELQERKENKVETVEAKENNTPAFYTQSEDIVNDQVIDKVSEEQVQEQAKEIETVEEEEDEIIFSDDENDGFGATPVEEQVDQNEAEEDELDLGESDFLDETGQGDWNDNQQPEETSACTQQNESQQQNNPFGQVPTEPFQQNDPFSQAPLRKEFSNSYGQQQQQFTPVEDQPQFPPQPNPFPQAPTEQEVNSPQNFYSQNNSGGQNFYSQPQAQPEQGMGEGDYYQDQVQGDYQNQFAPPTSNEGPPPSQGLNQVQGEAQTQQQHGEMSQHYEQQPADDGFDIDL